MALLGMIGIMCLLITFVACIASVPFFAVAIRAEKRGKNSETPEFIGRICVVLPFIALLISCGILVYCFLTGNVTFDYVLQNRSSDTGEFAVLYKIAGLWAGREGSLLFWAFLISAFNNAMLFIAKSRNKALNNAALLVGQAVLLAFASVLLLSPDNMPFTATDPRLFTESGELTNSASVYGMNSLLQHWAMAIHPPTLFIGYAGLTVPFAYAIGALIVNDDSDAWVLSSTPFLMLSWLFLGIGIGLGAVWAYVVLGWGGYWGWDPVENASLLPWLICVALVHSFTIYRKRGHFKRWAVMCSCLAFSFVVLGTFITRSGIVQSVHAFEGDPVSLVLFLTLVIASVLAGALGLFLRRKTFGAPSNQNREETESIFSREVAYYINNLAMVLLAFIVAYMTVSSALPAPLPLAGQSLSAGAYNIFARPLGVLYCALIAVCPLLGWSKTNPQTFIKKARIPAILALVAFALLAFYFGSELVPRYEEIIASGTSMTETTLEQGPGWYYNGVAIVGFAVAALLFFNSTYMVVQAFSALKKKEGPGRKALPLMAGSIAHAAMGIILVGLIGSSMYVSETVTYLPYDKESNTASETLKVRNYELVLKGCDANHSDTSPDVIYDASFDVYKNGEYIGSVTPAVQVAKATMQQKLVAAVLPSPTEDLFVVYRGVNDDGNLSMDVRVNPLINFVWAGFILLMLGTGLSLFAKRGSSRAS